MELTFSIFQLLVSCYIAYQLHLLNKLSTPEPRVELTPEEHSYVRNFEDFDMRIAKFKSEVEEYEKPAQSFHPDVRNLDHDETDKRYQVYDQGEEIAK